LQTFLPYKSFALSASVLDWRRLGKQRAEAKQIILALERGPFTCKHCKESKQGYASDRCPMNVIHYWVKTPWYEHAATRMWRGYKSALALYGWEVCRDWKERGYVDNTQEFFEVRLDVDPVLPPWLDDDFCLSHRSNLIRKLPEHYGQLWPDVPNDLPYVWPV